MATTTNYSWTTPDDTALVKDGAAAIRSLGTAIDTTVFNNAGAAIAKTIVDAKGDLIAATAADTVARLAYSGTNGDLLTVDTSTATGLKWATPAAYGGMTLLSTTTLSGASTAVSVTPTGYVNLYVEIIGMQNATGNYAAICRLNADSTIINYIGWQRWSKEQSGSSAGSVAGLTTNQNNQGGVSLYATTEAGLKASNGNNFTQLTIYNPNSTNRKLIRGSMGFLADNDLDFFTNFDADYRGTSTISTINISTVSGSFTAGTVYVYGVK